MNTHLPPQRKRAGVVVVIEEVNFYVGKVFLFTPDLCILMTAVFVVST